MLHHSGIGLGDPYQNSARNLEKISDGIILFIGSQSQPPITDLLRQLRSGDRSAHAELIAVLYPTLHRIARSYLRKERVGHTLQPTALLNEVYLKLFGRAEIQFVDRAHFFAVVSLAMRRILVDHARARAARGGEGRIHAEAALQLDLACGPRQVHLLDLDRALEALAREKSSLAELIAMRYFGGMTAEETAEVMGRSVHAVRYDLRLAHAWLRRELAESG